MLQTVISREFSFPRGRRQTKMQNKRKKKKDKKWNTGLNVYSMRYAPCSRPSLLSFPVLIRENSRQLPDWTGREHGAKSKGQKSKHYNLNYKL
jgi:hypothetical protein